MENRSPLTDIAQQICERRYFQKDSDGNLLEDWKGLTDRVVRHVCKNESDDFRDTISALIYNTEFLPNSPCLVNAGTSTKTSGLMACQPGWSRINTTKGLIRIKDLIEDTFLTDIPTYTGNAQITNRWRNGVKKVLQIETEKGYRLFVTEDHQVYTIKGYQNLAHKSQKSLKAKCHWESAGNLREGDALVLDFSEKPFPEEYVYKNDIKLDEDLARILAFTKCDGHLKYHSSGPKDHSYKVLVFEIIVDSKESLDLISNSPHIAGNIIDIDNKQNNTYLKRIRAYGKKYAYLFNFGEFGSLECDVPDEIFRSPRTVVSEFCRSAFDCEGTLAFSVSSRTGKNHCHVITGMTSESFIRDLQKLLNLFGIQSSIRGPVHDKRKDYHRNPMYYLSITNTVHMKKFQEHIGFINPRKKRMLDDYLASVVDKKYEKFAFSIKSIKDIGEHEVYDISTSNETYLSEGIVVHNCFVVKSPEDCWSGVKSGETGMIENIANFGHVARQGGGAGIDISNIRPEGDPVFGSTHAKACGPIEHMRMISEVMSSITQSGFRGMAMIACMRVDHPDIMKFIHCKQRDKALKCLLKEDIFDHYGTLKDNHHAHLDIVLDKFLSNFNISVSVTDDFMNKVKNDEEYDLVFNGKVYQTIRARKVFDAIVENAWNNGDPGLLFSDTINDGTYKWSGQTVTATNPCVTGDTLVSVADGRVAVPMKELANEDKDVPVYSRKPNGSVTIRMMRRPRISGYNQKILKVTITNGHVLRVTENHKFVLSDGSVKEAKDLNPNDSLSILTRLEAPFEAVLNNWNSKSQDYYWIKSSERKSWTLEHRMIYNFSAKKNISYSNGVIHHKDFNGLNNRPENLSHMTKQAHDELHSNDMTGDKNPMRRAKHEWSDDKWDSYRTKMSESTSGFKNGRSLKVTSDDIWAFAVDQTKQKGRKLSVPEWRQISRANGFVSHFTQFRKKDLGRVSEFLTNAAIEANVEGSEYSRSVLREYKKFLDLQDNSDLDVFFEDTIKVRKLCEYCGDKFVLPYYQREISFCSIQCALKKRNTSESMKQKVRDSKLRSLKKRRFNLLTAYNDLKTEIQRDPLKKEFAQYCKLHKVPFRIPSKNEVKRGELHAVFNSWTDLKDQANSFNHRIISVEPDGFENVYTGTVDEYHNYYIGNFEEEHQGKHKKYVSANNVQCGEIPIPENGSCNLGSIDVSKFYNENREVIEWTRLGKAIDTAIQFLDNVIDVNVFPTPDFTKWAKDNRPVGLGIMGWADLLLKMKITYGSEESLQLAQKVGKFFEKRAHNKSVVLGKERGTPKSCKYDELEHRRNAVTLSIAPTGTISLLAGCSSSIEPIFSPVIYRYDNTGSKEISHPYASKPWFKCAPDIDWSEHIKMQAAFQAHIDNSISKTINMSNSATKEDIENAYTMAWETKCKGVTVYRDGSKTTQVLNSTFKGAINSNQAKPRPKEVPVDIFKTRADGFEWHILVGKVDNIPYEIFAVNGKQELPSTGKIIKRKRRHYSLLDNDNEVLIENIGQEEDEIHPDISLETRRCSLELRHNIDPKYIVEQIDKSTKVITSFSKASGRILKRYVNNEDLQSNDVACPDCAKNGNIVDMVAEGGCWTCPVCYYSKCG